MLDVLSRAKVRQAIAATMPTSHLASGRKNAYLACMAEQNEEAGALDPADPYEREAQTFPLLSKEQARRVAGYGTEEQLADGALVFERGQRSVDFFLVLDGAIEIFDTDAHDRPNVFTVHRARQFTGEMDLFNDRQILVSGRAGGPRRWCGSPGPTSGA